MSGSEFEREHIVAGTLSASAASKPADAARELHTELHTWRPEAEGLYDPSLEKDSCGVGAPRVEFARGVGRFRLRARRQRSCHDVFALEFRPAHFRLPE